MAGFVRRYGYFPGTEVITQIEGTVIVDLPPPGAVEGVGTGTVALVGEFADCTYAVQAGSSGDIGTKLRPVEVFSTQDLLNKVGGFDETLGDFGNSLGNGFCALRNKRFSRLVLAPINLASAWGARFTRELPLCTSQTNTLPVVPVSGATISAGREFRSGVGRIRIAQTVQYTARNPIDDGTGGSIATAGAPAVTQPFTAARSATTGRPSSVPMATSVRRRATSSSSATTTRARSSRSPQAAISARAPTASPPILC